MNLSVGLKEVEAKIMKNLSDTQNVDVEITFAKFRDSVVVQGFKMQRKSARIFISLMRAISSGQPVLVEVDDQKFDLTPTKYEVPIWRLGSHSHCTTLNGNNGEVTNSDDMELSRVSPNFALHGKYVGPGHTGGKNLGEENFSTEPVDALDKGARQHDWTYKISQDDNVRRAADWVLARDAYLAAGDMKGFNKMKAYAVAAGMTFKGALGGKDFSKLEMVPTTRAFKKSHYARLDKAIQGGLLVKKPNGKKVQRNQRVQQINGNNGSFTNLDDVNNKAKKNQKRKLAKKKKKQVKKNYSQKVAVQKALVPDLMRAKTKIKSFVKAIGPKRFAICLPIGNLNTGTAKSSGGNFITGSVVFSRSINRDVFAGTELELHFAGNEEWKLVGTSHSLVTSMGSNVNGSLYEFSDPDPSDVLVPNQVVDSALISSHETNEKRTMWPGWENAPAKLQTKWLYTDTNFVRASTIINLPGAEDTRLASAGIVNVALGGSVGTSVTEIGEMYLHGVIEFRNSQRTDMQYLIASGKFAEVNPSAFIQPTTAVSMDVFSTIVNATSANYGTGAVEYVYNPTYCSLVGGTNFNLPIGTYLIYAEITSVGTETSPNLAGALFITNGVMSYRKFDGPDAAGSTVVEFSNQAITASGSFNQTYGQLMMFRITQATGSNGFANITFQFTPSFSTNPLKVATMVFVAMRIPNFQVDPLACIFPLGSTGRVSLTSIEKGLLDLFDSTDQDQDRKFAAIRLYKINRAELALRIPQVWKYLHDKVFSDLLVEELIPNFSSDVRLDERKVRECTEEKTLVSNFVHIGKPVTHFSSDSSVGLMTKLGLR